MNRLNDVLGDKIKDAIPLYSFGINEMAWDFDNVIEIISLLRTENIPILGGDVYLINDGIVKATFDSWYFDNIINLDCEYSYEKTIEYIMIFEKKDEKYVYSIVI
jgi:hypothetical protein